MVVEHLRLVDGVHVTAANQRRVARRVVVDGDARVGERRRHPWQHVAGNHLAVGDGRVVVGA